LDQDVAELDGEARHLRRMLAIRSRFEGLGARSATLEAVLDTMRDAALLVDSGRRITYANRAGEALLRQGELLVVERGRLGAARQPSHTTLVAAIAAACDPSASCAGAVRLERRDGRTSVTTVTPFKLPHRKGQALLLTHDDGTGTHQLALQLRRLFGLTRSEAQIAVRIGDGLAIAEIAAERRVAADTIRSQVKSLMAKLGCRRQSEVVALTKTIPLPPPEGIDVRI
jgi:DNA-binding CsgD family transcriptional regulator